MKIRIHVTKEILEAAKYCPYGSLITGNRCAIALAVRDILPGACVGETYIDPFGVNSKPSQIIDLPDDASKFICRFDNLKNRPEARAKMKPISFDIEVTDSVIEVIGITEVHRILSESKTLERV